MTRITDTFARLKKEKKPAFMPFMVAGDPNFAMSLRILLQLAKTADILEIGFPYSDPLADGPAIQAAGQRALKNGMTTGKAFQLVKKVRQAHPRLPIVLMVYANLVYARGIKQFYAAAANAGTDGVLVPDLPLEEAAPYIAAARQRGIDPVFLAAQTTPSARLRQIFQQARGFLYAVSVLGVTGERKRVSPQTIRLIRRLKKTAALPVAVGFGISSPAQARAVVRAGADGYIVGSLLVSIVGRNPQAKDLPQKIHKLARTFKD